MSQSGGEGHINFSDSSIVSAIVAGALAGSLHAVTGPDHLAALLPMCMGRRWYRSMNVGGQWGLGHGVGASLMVRAGAKIQALSSSFSVGLDESHSLVWLITIRCYSSIIGGLSVYRQRNLQYSTAIW